MDAAPAKGDPATPTQETRAPESPKISLWMRPAVIVAGTVLLGFVLFLGLRYLAESFTHESTDDAFLDGDIISVAPKVAGQVKKVYVVSNQRVKAGELLLEIDPKDLAVQTKQKQAALESAHANASLIRSSLGLLQAQVDTAQATAKQTAAEAAASEATAAKAKADLSRADELMKEKTISPQEYDSARTAAAAAAANLKAAQEKAASDQFKIAETQAQLEAGRKAFERAQAQERQGQLDLEQAELNLSYARITAANDGQVTRKSVADGDYVQVGQRLMALVQSQMWVTANFKETQLKRIRPRQPATLRIDSLGGPSFPGHVDSIQAGSGARFSLLPPENAVGNYVKVVQRVPVRILFDATVQGEHALGPGMSVVPSVRVKDYQVPEAVLALAAIVLALGLGVFWYSAARRKPNRS